MGISSDQFTALTIPGKGFDLRVAEVAYNWEVDGLLVNGKFFYLTLRDRKPTIHEFVEFVGDQIVYYCLPPSEINAIRKKFDEDGDVAHWTRATHKARHLFVRAKKDKQITGEPGELIIFLILEIVMKCPQIIAKMRLKTSSKVHFHGGDGIHASFMDETNELMMIWGESKFHASLSGALKAGVKSIKSFAQFNDPQTGQARDLELARDFISLGDDKLEESITAYLDPYDAKSHSLLDCHALLVGFDHDGYDIAAKPNSRSAKEVFEEDYLKVIKQGCEEFVQTVRKEEVETLRFMFFLLPFKDVDDFRKRFLTYLGLS